MSSRHHTDDFMRGRIIGKIEEGRKITDVAREFDIAHSVVSRLWNKWNRRTTAQQVANQFLAALGKQISRKTIARRLRGGGLYARRPVVCVPLTRQHSTARLQRCREHHNWTQQNWACVLFSDERKGPISDMQYQGVGRHHDQWPHAPTCGCEWNYDGQRYIDEVLLPHVRLFHGAVDLNPIENVWDALGRQVAGRNYPPTNKNTLIRALTEEWDKLPQQLLDNVVQSMVRRVEYCIALHGGHIPY
ncbi:transposable element Tcb1 transposase [Trichonephila clavipes]|nr:transposable element Tcb1 transposase [Trichonephila clavipes]